MRVPWTREELQAALPKIDRKIAEVEEEYPNAKPLPRLTVEEATDLLIGLVDKAEDRPLTAEEFFLHGQLLSVYKQAVIAESRGYKGRYFVITEEMMLKVIKSEDPDA